jgi:uncharacterized protein (DUF1501 family)
MTPRSALAPIRRRTLLAGLGVGLSLAFMGRAAPAAAMAGRKLAVVICRGAMDGLSVLPPWGDPDYARLRGALAIAAPGTPDGALSLEGTRIDPVFGLHPALTGLQALARAGQLRVAPAVALPQHVRSHFEAQDLLESGGARLYQVDSGWLNRALTALGADGRAGLSVGAAAPLILRGPVRAGSWSVGPAVRNDRLTTLLQGLYQDDPLLGPALASGLGLEAQVGALDEDPPVRPGQVRELAMLVARLMTAADGPDLVALSLEGFDTHAGQGAATGQLAGRLALLDRTIDGLRDGLAGGWDRTAVLVLTEFGRTARANGTGGTDHGTAAAALLAGGAVAPGGLLGDWPGLGPGRLYEDRDLAPTLDMRALLKGVLRDHLGIDRAALDSAVFPESTAIRPADGLIRA